METCSWAFSGNSGRDVGERRLPSAEGMGSDVYPPALILGY